MEPGEQSSLLSKVKKPASLQRTIGVFSAAAILFGNCVGAGIFISPKGVYEMAGSAGAGLMVWAIGGIVATLCTLAYAELGTMIPVGGGEFAYISQTYGKFLAFIFSFCMAFLVRPAALAVVALVFSEYMSNLVWGQTLSIGMLRVIAACLIAVATILNIFGVKIITVYISFASIVKFIAIGFLLVCGITVAAQGKGQIDNFRPTTSFIGSSTRPADYTSALYFCVFSFQYWNSLNYIYDEMKSPETTLPRSGMIGMLGVSVSYILSNVAYLLLFPLQKIVSTNTIAMDSGFQAFGKAGEIVMSVGLLVSCAGTIGGGMLCVSRNIQVTAQQNVFPHWMSWISPTFHTPVPAILTLGCTMCVYLMFDVFLLIPFLGTVEWLFYCITFSITIYLRYTQPDLHRPFRFPIFVSAFLFLISGALVILPLFSSKTRMTTLLGLCWLPVAALFYGAQYLCTRYCSKSSDKVPRKSGMDSGYTDSDA